MAARRRADREAARGDKIVEDAADIGDAGTGVVACAATWYSGSMVIAAGEDVMIASLLMK